MIVDSSHSQISNSSIVKIRLSVTVFYDFCLHLTVYVLSLMEFIVTLNVALLLKLVLVQIYLLITFE